MDAYSETFITLGLWVTVVVWGRRMVLQVGTVDLVNSGAHTDVVLTYLVKLCTTSRSEFEVVSGWCFYCRFHGFGDTVSLCDCCRGGVAKRSQIPHD